MSFYSKQTDKINGKIASLKTITDISIKKYEMLKSEINNLMDSILSIIKQLGGYDDMVSSIQTILSEKLDDIEEIIKSAIKIAIKQIISCGVEPSISDELINEGVSLQLDKIDPLSILSVDPLSENGTYSYFDNLSGTNSKDFNVYLYTIIKKTLQNNQYNGDIWYKNDIENNENVRKPMFRATYQEYDDVSMRSSILTIKIDESFRNKKLSYFISEYLDSIKLFNSVQIISTIFDELFGTRVISFGKTKDQLLIEKKIENIINKLLNNIEDETDTIDDSYFSFSNETYDLLIEQAENKRLGKYAKNNSIEIDRDLILNSMNGLKVDNLTTIEQTKVLNEAIDSISNQLSENNGDNADKMSHKKDIIDFILSRLMLTMSLVTLSPKIIYLFSLTNKILGIEDDSDAVSFIKSNINIYKLIILKIREIIMEVLIEKIKELMAPMISTLVKELVKEKMSIYKSQLQTLTNKF